MAKETYGFGWLPDVPDFRDLNPETDQFKKLIEARALKTEIPDSVDLRKWCSTVENQGNLGSCTANAGVGMVEYYENRRFGKYLDASRLFLYKTTRNLMGLSGDTGAFIRDTFKALVLFGTCPEEYWPYTDSKQEFDREPTAFCYSFASNYKTISYFRLDTADIGKTDLLERIKLFLANGYPVEFGFTVYSSIYDAKVKKSGDIPYPGPGDRRMGGHAVMAVGYDDDRKVLRIRNSWGSEWGDKGYGTLPYRYVLNDLALDFWSILKNDWVDVGDFE